jgi:general secretion pathway protein A
MYQGYWGLKHSPFAGTPAREALMASPVHAEALARLDFVSSRRGALGLLLGAAGSGKSALLTQFVERATRSGTLVCALDATGADECLLTSTLSLGLQIEPAAEASSTWQCVLGRLDELCYEGLSAVLILDNLDRATSSGLAVVERLLSLSQAPLTVIGAARPETVQQVGQRLLDQVALRIDLTPWSEEETCGYLESALAAAGRSERAFKPAAVRRLVELSGGAPRRVNQLAELALLAGAGQQLREIDTETIDAVEQELCVAR